MTDRLTEALKRSRTQGGAVMPFVVIGDPDETTSHKIVDAILRTSPDILEFGLPFSDPPADGPIIQAADQRALAKGMTVSRALDFLRAVRTRSECPIALLIYYNLVLNRGVDRFYEEAKNAGVDAILVADVPVEESGPLITAAERTGIAPIFIVSELTNDDRLERILQVARGYLYLVARLGVTGASTEIDDRLKDLIARIRARTSLPLLPGFGISTPDHVAQVIEAGADGAIFGSAIVHRIAEHLGDEPTLLQSVETFCREMKRATTRRDSP